MANVRKNLAVTVTAGGTNPLKMKPAQSVLKIATAGSFALIGQGGTAPYAFSMVSGALPTVATVTGSITANVLTTTAVANGALAIGQVIAGAGITYGTKITGGGGTTWNVTSTPNVASETITASPALSAAGIATFATGTLPSVAGTSAFVVQVQDSAATVYTAALTASVAHVLSWTNQRVFEVDNGVGTPTYALAVSGNTGTLSFAGSGLPAHTTLNTSTGLLTANVSGFDAAGTYGYTVTATDSGSGDSIVLSISQKIYSGISITYPGGAGFAVSIGFSSTLNLDNYVSGWKSPFIFTLDPTVSPPSWVSISGSTLTFAPPVGTASQAYTYRIIVTDSLGSSVGFNGSVKAVTPNNALQAQKGASNVGSAGSYNLNVTGLAAPDVANDGTTVTWTFNPDVTRARLATTAALAANTYANGTLGVGATITMTATGTLTVDGVVTALADILLIKNEAGLSNGAYLVTTAGAVGVAAVLTRITHMDEAGEFTGSLVSTGPDGTTNKSRIYICTAVAPITVGTTAITFALLPGQLLNTRVFISGTSFVSTEGAVTFAADLFGAGGGGGGAATAAASAAAGGGGGAGGCTRIYRANQGAGTYTYSLGGGGGGGTNLGGNGGNGGNTTLTMGATNTANGGTGGAGSAAVAAATFRAGGAGGASGGGALIQGPGQPGGNGIILSGTVAASGAGGGNYLVAGPAGLTAAGAGTNGGTLGFGAAGGSGALVLNGSAGVAGGNGANGMIVLYEYS